MKEELIKCTVLMKKLGPVQEKILIILLGGVALGLCRSSVQYYKLLKALHKGWKEVNQGNFNRSIRLLCKNKLVDEVYLQDGSYKLVLTSEGKRYAGLRMLLKREIYCKKPNRWDKKWRIVIFDIPETDREFRGILREHLKHLGFLKLQQSVFVSPHPFEKQILKLISLYNAGEFVRVITAEKIDNEKHIHKFFFGRNRKNKH